MGLLPKSEVTVGDTWVVPASSNNSYSSATGNITLTFVGIQDITVPAGTYKVFRVDTASDDTVIRACMPRPNASTIISTFNMTFTGQTYIEYGTGRQIERDMHIKGTVQSTLTANPESEIGCVAVNSPIFDEDAKVQTQLIRNIEPNENSTLPPSDLWNPSSDEQALMSFLRDEANLDVGHYSIQFSPSEATAFGKCTLTSADSSVDVLFIVNNSRVVWCKLYALSGSPVFSESSASNLEAAKSFLDRYQNHAQTSYVPTLRSMIDNFSWLTEGMQDTSTISGGTFTSSSELDGLEVNLNLTVYEDALTFAWSKTMDSTQSIEFFALTIRNGQFEFFTDTYIGNI